VTLFAAEELCDMMFTCELMADPVVASDGITYERDSIQLWMRTHDASPHTNTPFDHQMLIPNIIARKQIAAWCEENSVPVPVAPKRMAEAAVAGGGAALAPLLQKPHVTCALHENEPVRVFCKDCCRGVCTLCAVDTKRCKAHAVEALDALIEELQADGECWARAREECARSAQQLCATIQADANAKIQTIAAEAAVLQQEVQLAAAARSTALGAIVDKRRERVELVVGAAASPDVAVKGSAAAAVVAAALGRVKTHIPPASAAEFRGAAAPAAAVGHVLVADAVLDPEGSDYGAATAPPLAAVAAALSPACRPPECDWVALKNDGYSARELKIAGCSWALLLALEYDLPSMKAAGYDAAAFRAARCSWTDLFAAGFTASEVKAAGCDISAARAAGFDLPSMKAAGYDAAAFRAARCSWTDLFAAGFTASEVKAAGCDISAARAAGFDLPSLKAAGYDAAAFRAARCSWAEMNTGAGFTARELRPFGCDFASAKSAGYDVANLVSAFGSDAVAAAGVDLSSRILVSFLLQSCTHPHAETDFSPSPFHFTFPPAPRL
jgi:ribosomal protein L13E